MSDLSRSRLLLVGCGKMGGAMLRGWLARGLVARNAVVVEPSPAALGDLAGRGIIHAGTPDGIASDFAADVVVLAVKPQFMGEAIAYFRRHLGADAAVVRAMPNTPAAIGRGISVAVADGAVAPAQRELAE